MINAFPQVAVPTNRAETLPLCAEAASTLRLTVAPGVSVYCWRFQNGAAVVARLTCSKPGSNRSASLVHAGSDTNFRSSKKKSRGLGLAQTWLTTVSARPNRIGWTVPMAHLGKQMFMVLPDMVSGRKVVPSVPICTNPMAPLLMLDQIWSAGFGVIAAVGIEMVPLILG